MSTNYYLVPPPRCARACEHCVMSDPSTPREEPLHIYKTGGGFQAYVDSRFGPLLTSHQWTASLSAAVNFLDWHVEDENGHQVNLEEFITLLGATPDEERRRQYDWAVNANKYGTRDRDHTTYLDVAGFSMTLGDFS